MKPRIRIVSYFSIPTDLAGTMRDWPEFVSGSGYDVDLRSSEEEVQLRYKDGEDDSYVLVSSSEADLKGSSLTIHLVRAVVAAQSGRSTVAKAMMDRETPPAVAERFDGVRSLDAQLSARQRPYCAPMRRQAT